ncbi:MAG: tetratricopeptide repeat protein, partial [Armatimonadetes bacterium]|nr:tetratricopeptide repeat protein [Armatimonadota bacterium]
AFAYDRLAPTPRAGVKDLDAAIAAAELDAWIGEGRKAAKSKDFIAWHRLATLLCRSLLGSGPPRTFSDERTTRAIAALEDAVRTARSGARVNEGVFAGPFGYASARVVAVAGFAYPEAAWDYVTMESLRSLRADASDEYALLNLASALVETGEAGPASVLLPDLARMRSGDPEVTFLRARVAIADDDLDSAEKLLREVLVANPRHPEAHRHLARILAERGDWSGAGATLAARSAVYGPDVRSDGGGDGL